MADTRADEPVIAVIRIEYEVPMRRADAQLILSEQADLGTVVQAAHQAGAVLSVEALRMIEVITLTKAYYDKR